mgnify:CR=1 FL=1
MKSFFTPKDVRELADVSYRQIQYWDKSNFISPSYRRRGKYRLYTFGDVLQIKIVETLRKKGYSVQQLRETIDTLRSILKKISFAVQGIRKETLQPVGIAITPDGKTVFVALGPANRVAVIDADTYEVKQYLLVGQRVWQLAFTPDYKTLLSVNGDSNDVSVIDVASLKVLKSITVGELPWGAAIK